MAIRSDSVAQEVTAKAVRALCAARMAVVLAILAGLGSLGPAFAQFTMAGSDLAGVIFQSPSNLWIPDAARSQARALDQASALVDRACGPTEFHIWFALGSNRDVVRTGTDTAFAEAGWSLAVIDIEAEGDRVYLASRAEDELVMAWLPLSESIGLVLCRVVGPRVADAGVAEIQDPAMRLIPLPRPRPDPNAPPPPDDGEADAPMANDVADVDPVGVDPEILPAVDRLEDTPGEVIGGIIVATAEDDVDQAPVIDNEDPPSESRFSIGLLLLAAALGVGAFFMVRWGRDSARAIAGAAWPTTLATVIYTEIASEDGTSRSGAPGARYVPVVAYQYEVDGTTHQAARLRFGDSSEPTIERAKETIDKFPLGAGIEIRYDPANHSDATIEADPDRLELRLIGGIALAVLALAALISALG